MLERITVIDKIEVIENGTLQVRRATYLIEEGVRGELLGYHRTCYAPGAEIPDEVAQVQAVAAAVWTPEVVKAYVAFVAKVDASAAPETPEPPVLTVPLPAAAKTP